MVAPLLLLLADGRFPSGGHAYSAGVEAAARVGDVDDEATFARYLRGRLSTSAVTDASFAAAGVGGVERGEHGPWWAALGVELDARQPAPRSRVLARRFGRQLARAGAAAWPSATLEGLVINDAVRSPIVLGVLVASAGGSAIDAATISLHHQSSAMTSAAVRLLGLDPIRLAGIQATVAPMLDELASAAPIWASGAPGDLPALGGALTEILAEDHGAWDARLFAG